MPVFCCDEQRTTRFCSQCGTSLRNPGKSCQLAHSDWQQPANQFAGNFRTHLLIGNFEKCREIVDDAERELPLVKVGSQFHKLPRHKKLNLFLTQLKLEDRTVNDLERGDITTVGEVLALTRDEFLSIPNVGEKKLREVIRALQAIGFTSSTITRDVDKASEVSA